MSAPPDDRPTGSVDSAPAGRSAARRSQPSRLGDTARFGLFAGIAASFVLSVAALAQYGWAEGVVCLLGTAALLACSLPLALGPPRRLVEPIWFIILIVGIGVTGKVFYLILGPEVRVANLLLGKRPEDLMFAALLIVVSLICLSLGYLLGSVRWRIPFGSKLIDSPWHRRRFVAVSGGLLLLGLLAFLVFVVQLNLSVQSLSDLSSKRFVDAPEGGGVFVRGYLRWGAMLVEIAFYLVFVDWVAQRRRLHLASASILGLLAALSFAFPVIVSSRQTVMLLVIRLILIWIAVRGEPKLRHVGVLVAGSLLVIGSMLALRRGVSSWEGIQQHLGMDTLAEVTVGSWHFLDLSKTAHVIAAVPEKIGYRYGETLITWLVAPVPRSWWPEKPIIGLGGELGSQVFGTFRGGVPPGIVGELYLNFGPAGVLLGMLFVGFLLRSLYATLMPYFPNRAAVVLFSIVSTRVALDILPNSVSNGMVRLLQDLVPLVLALALIAAKKPGAAGHPARSAPTPGAAR